MKTFMRVFLVAIFFGLIFFLSVYAYHHTEGILDPQGVIALAEKNLMITAVLLMLIPVIPIFFMLAWFSYAYRAGNTKAKYMPDWHSNMIIEAVWWTIPTIIVIILGIMTWKSTHELDPYKPLDSSVPPITIQVVALDWKWLFIYPNERIATVNYVVFPQDVPVNFRITADAPMNAFHIPQLGGQVYAMKGMTAQLHLMASAVGDYKGLSTNFSGDGFSDMRFVAHVVTDDEYKSWVDEVKGGTGTLSKELYDNVLVKPSVNNPADIYSNVEENLYTTIIMKFMPSMQHHMIDESVETNATSDMVHTSEMEGMEHAMPEGDFQNEAQTPIN